MATLNFTTKIKAAKEKVWQVLWNDDTYRKWTAPFMEGSYASSDWNEGSKIQFLDPKGSGIFGVIEKKIPNKQMTFKHLGEIKNGIEEMQDWGEAKEDYSLSESDGTTDLKVSLSTNVNAQFEEYFRKTFPKAIEIIKQLSENENL